MKCFPLQFESDEIVNIRVEEGATVTTNGTTYPLYAWDAESLSLSGEEK